MLYCSHWFKVNKIRNEHLKIKYDVLDEINNGSPINYVKMLFGDLNVYTVKNEKKDEIKYEIENTHIFNANEAKANETSIKNVDKSSSSSMFDIVMMMDN